MPTLKKPTTPILTAPKRPRKTPSKAAAKPVAKKMARSSNRSSTKSSARAAPRPLGQWLYRRRRPLSQVAAVLGIVAGMAWTGYWTVTNDVPSRTMVLISETLDDASRVAGLTVAEVVVVGRKRATRDDIYRALGVKRDDPILTLDMINARQRLEALGWVHNATITRRLPGEVHVHLVERQPFALWQKNQHLSLIDRDGVEITSKNLGRFASLPTVVGKDAPGNVGVLFEILATEPDLFSRVVAAVRIAGRRWDIRLGNDVVIRLPEDNPMQGWKRLANLQKEHSILGRDLAAIDLRLEDRLIVRLGAKAAKLRRQPGNNT